MLDYLRVKVFLTPEDEVQVAIVLCEFDPNRRWHIEGCYSKFFSPARIGTVSQFSRGGSGQLKCSL
jgi:hypothetical protein